MRECRDLPRDAGLIDGGQSSNQFDSRYRATLPGPSADVMAPCRPQQTFSHTL
jgi:hypothetical protein